MSTNTNITVRAENDNESTKELIAKLRDVIASPTASEKDKAKAREFLKQLGEREDEAGAKAQHAMRLQMGTEQPRHESYERGSSQLVVGGDPRVHG